jgi:hypothetical protein
MPGANDDVAAYYRLAAVAALALAATSAREEWEVVTSTFRLQLRAITREFVSELGTIRHAARSRLIAIVGCSLAACAATKPSETSFDGWFRKFSGRLSRAESGESTSGASAGGVVGKVREAYEVYARTLLQSIGVSSSGVASMAFWREKISGGGGSSKREQKDWMIARSVVLGKKVAFVGVAGFWWGPFPTLAYAKEAASSLADAKDQIQDLYENAKAAR